MTQLNKLLDFIAYSTYKRIYDVRDEPLEKVTIHLSEDDNEWNLQALQVQPFQHQSDITILNNEPVAISDKNNTWNKIAIKLEKSEENI